MLLAEQIGSWSPLPSGPCRKWRLYMARLRRVGLVGSLARDNAEWLSALYGHAGIENRICRIIHPRARGVSKRGGIDPEGLEARGSGQQHFVLSSFFSSFHPSFRFEGGGVLGKRLAETPLPHHTPGTR